MTYQTNRGFSLIELLIVMVVIGIIMSISVPSYRQYLQRANRADATTALLRIAAAQERFFIQNGTYASNAQLGLDPPAGLGFPGTERGFYDLAIAAPPGGGGLAAGYVVTATVNAGESQHDDTDCWAFSTNERGQFAAETNGGGDSTADCWR